MTQQQSRSGLAPAWLLQGHWAGAVAVASTALGVALAVSTLVVLLSDLPDASAWDRLVAAGCLATAAFGVDVVTGASLDEEGLQVDLRAAAGTVPLLVSVLALGAAAWVFRRQTRPLDDWRFAARHALQAAGVFAGLVLAVAVVLRSGFEALSDPFAGALGDEAERLSFGPGRLAAPFLGFAAMLLVLGGAALVRRDWLPAGLQRLHDLLAPAAQGLALLLLLLPVAGVAGYLALLTGDGAEAPEELGWNRRVALGAAGAGNAGLAYVGLGAGGRLGASFGVDARGAGGFAEEVASAFGAEPASEHRRLGRLADETGMWGLWGSLPVMLLLLGVVAWYVVRRSRASRTPLAAVLVWCAATVVAFPALAWLASLRATAGVDLDYEGRPGSIDVSLAAGLPVADALLLSLACCVLTLLTAVWRGAPRPAPRPPG